MTAAASEHYVVSNSKVQSVMKMLEGEDPMFFRHGATTRSSHMVYLDTEQFTLMAKNTWLRLCGIEGGDVQVQLLVPDEGRYRVIEGLNDIM